ncbi:GerW family sporulation protein [Flavilitoribacter nigricans]|uniref:Sporulation protein n=1 Tax=Flavilitoribacter nigricans (strain ATCC 23147 / DSM 23189 / NBRC 102662 / NCIMB 1420 / SS-2) TaxID=1122177 RepID=A0A2D0MZM8_FLAN2|nr:spore germination protein GerW family protein [Flavilitoribacter nigricans]PHN01705.1 sporulation protein [Flavilitoribacter nigricans DSM 23189 = NBRC 102662]
MEIQFKEMIDQITQFMRSEAKTSTVIGEAFQLGEFQCIPVIRVGMGFGTGGGEGDAPQQGHGEGGGLGAGIGIEPIGFLVSQGDSISFVSTRTNKGLAAAFEKVPDLIEKYLEKQPKEEAVA